MVEYWKDIKDYLGLYQVSNLGRVKSLPKLDTCNQLKNEELAYNLGYRVNEIGNLYHINGKNYKINISKKGVRFCINIGNKKNITVYVGRLQAFQKFGNEFLKYNRIIYLDGNKLNTSKNNIDLGKGAERLKKLNISSKLNREQIAVKLGFNVTKDGVLKLNGIKHHTGLNNYGYKTFCFSIDKNKSLLVLVHRLQAFQKFGNELYIMPLVRHLDNNKLNNSIDNIQLGNHLDNYNDIPKIQQIARYKKSANSKCKYTIVEREKFRKNFNSDIYTVSSYAQFCNVAQRTMYSIINKTSKFLDNG